MLLVPTSLLRSPLRARLFLALSRRLGMRGTLLRIAGGWKVMRMVVPMLDSTSRRRLARRLRNGRTSRLHRPLRFLRCRSPKPPHRNRPHPTPFLFPLPPHLSSAVKTRPCNQTQRPAFPLLHCPPSWTTELHHGHECHSYYPHSLLTCYFRLSMALCLDSARSLRGMSWLGGSDGKGMLLMWGSGADCYTVCISCSYHAGGM